MHQNCTFFNPKVLRKQLRWEGSKTTV